MTAGQKVVRAVRNGAISGSVRGAVSGAGAAGGSIIGAVEGAGEGSFAVQGARWSVASWEGALGPRTE